MSIIRNTNLTNVNDLIFYLDATNFKSYPGSGSTWNDLSPNRNHFTLFNTPTYTPNGTTGTYLTFNGTNQYARSTNAINFNAYLAVTIEIGYRSTVTNATQILYETTGTGGSTATGGISLLMNANNTSTVANVYLSQWQGYGPRLFGYTSNTNTSFNSVVETFVNGSDSTGRQAYVNGTVAQFFASTAVAVVTSATTSGLSFANTWTYVASRAGTSNFFRGDIAYVRAWGKKLGTSDLGNNVSAIAARQPNSYTNASIITNDTTLKTVLYSFASATFTTGGATDRIGPSIAQARTGVNQPAWSSTYLNMTHTGVQQWTVAADGIYEITTNGARGGFGPSGNTEGSSGSPGRGARVVARFSLSAGTILNIIVGQTGQADVYGQGAGGGGGTFVSSGSNLESSNLLVAAGGGGGRPWTNNGGTYNAVLSDGQAGTSGAGVGGGTNGSGGQRSGIDNIDSFGGNGGGWLSAGISHLQSGRQASGPRVQAAASPSGGESTYSPTSHGGGFGGGGAAWGGAGAGGGYSGGGAGSTSPNNGGPGGGSYVNPSAISNTITSGPGSNYGDGFVTIVYQG